MHLTFTLAPFRHCTYLTQSIATSPFNAGRINNEINAIRMKVRALLPPVRESDRQFTFPNVVFTAHTKYDDFIPR